MDEAMAAAVEERVTRVVAGLEAEGMKRTSSSANRTHLRRVEWWCAQRGTTLLEAPGELVWEYLWNEPRSTRSGVRAAIRHAWRIGGRADDDGVLDRVGPRLAEVQMANGARPVRTSGLDTVHGRSVFFRRWLIEREYSEKTVIIYVREAMRCDSWCEEHLRVSLRKVPGDRLLEYVGARPSSWATRHMIRSALTAYWKATERKNAPTWAIKVPKAPKGVCRAITEDDAAVLAAHARERGDARGFAMLLGLYQAMRREEIASAEWDWFDREPGWLHVHGKGDKSRRIHLHPVVAEAAAALEREHRRWVFPGRRVHGGDVSRNHVVPATIWQWVRDVADDAGLKDVAIRPHRLRHTALATVNDQTGDLRAAQNLAGHERPDTTAIYTRTTDRRMREAVEAIVYEPSLMPMPTVPYEAVVAVHSGAHAVPAWKELGAALLAGGGWRFELDKDGMPSWRSERLVGVWATAAAQSDGAATFELWRSLDPVDEALLWEYSAAHELVAAAVGLAGGQAPAVEAIRLGPWLEQPFVDWLNGEAPAPWAREEATADS